MAKSLQELRNTVAQNLSAILFEKGITQKDVASRFQVGRATVSNWCSGIKKPRTETLMALSEWLGVPLNYLIGVGPFEHWDHIRLNLSSFFEAVDLVWGSDKLYDIATLLYGIEVEHPEAAKLCDLAYFVNDNFLKAELTEDGWVVESNINEEKTPVTEGQKSQIQELFDQLSPANQSKLIELAHLYLASQRKTEETP